MVDSHLNWWGKTDLLVARENNLLFSVWEYGQVNSVWWVPRRSSKRSNEVKFLSLILLTSSVMPITAANVTMYEHWVQSLGGIHFCLFSHYRGTLHLRRGCRVTLLRCKQYYAFLSANTHITWYMIDWHANWGLGVVTCQLVMVSGLMGYLSTEIQNDFGVK